MVTYFNGFHLGRVAVGSIRKELNVFETRSQKLLKICIESQLIWCSIDIKFDNYGMWLA